VVDLAGTPAPAPAPKPVRHLKRKRQPQRNKAKTIAQRQKAQKKIILDCLRQGMTVQSSCEKAGVSAWNFPHWCRQDKRF
jgi:hypothetical protein